MKANYREYRRDSRRYVKSRKEAAIAQKVALLVGGVALVWAFLRYTTPGQKITTGVKNMAKQYVYPARAKPWLPVFQQAEGRYQLPEGLLVRVAQQESGFDPQAYNKSSGASGMMQIVPKWHPDIKNPYDPVYAIPYAAMYLRQLYNQFGSWRLALAAYNWGPGNLKNKGIAAAPLETRNYMAQILADLPGVV